MARLDYTGVPDAEPSLEAPNDFQHIESSPSAFGSQLGAATEDLGASLLKTSQFYGQVAADQATNNYLDQSNKILYGDPGKPATGPDGKPSPDTGFFGLRGANAMSARPQVEQRLDELIQEQREGLQTPRAKQQYDVDTRRYRAQALEKVSRFADAEQKTWAKDTNTTTATIALNDVARVAGDDAASAEAGQRVRFAYARNAQLEGLDPQGASLKADQDVAQARIRALTVSDPVAAQRVLDQSGGILGSLPNYDSIARTVKGAAFAAQESPFVDGVVSGALASAQSSVAGSGGAAAGPAPAHVLAPKGGAYDQIAQVAAKRPGTTSEMIATAQRTAQLESSGNPGAGSPSGRYHGLFQYPADGPQGVEAQTNAFLDQAQQNGQILNQAGIRPTSADLYIMHQQGPAGGKALLTAPQDMNAIAALTPAYQGHGRTPEQAQALATQAITHNGGSADMSAGDFVHLWRQKFGGGGAASSGQTMSVADNLRTQMPTILANTRAAAEKQFPNYPDQVDRVVDRVERQLNQTISQQDQQYSVDSHVVQSVMAADHPPISEAELTGRGPQVAQAWTRMQIENPLGAASVQRMFDANAKGREPVYGSQFKDYLDRALAPSADPDRIKDPSGLWGFVGSGPDAVITNSGVNAISDMIGQRGTPQGEAFASQVKGFVDQMHAQLTFTNKVTGVIDHKGEAQFSKFMAQALPILVNAQKNGTTGKVLDPNSPDYIGKLSQTFMRPPAELMKDRLADTAVQTSATPYTALTLARDLGSLDNDAQRADALKAAVAAHRLTPDVYRAYLASKTAVPGSPPPAPALVAPAPVPAAQILNRPGLPG